MCSSVDFPEPDLPMMAYDCPEVKVYEVFDITEIVVLPCVNFLVTVLRERIIEISLLEAHAVGKKPERCV